MLAESYCAEREAAMEAFVNDACVPYGGAREANLKHIVWKAPTWRRHGVPRSASPLGEVDHDDDLKAGAAHAILPTCGVYCLFSIYNPPTET